MLAVVFHIDELAKWALTLGNVGNLLKETPAIKVVVVVNAAAIEGYLAQTLTPTIEALQARGVVFEACSNALKAYEITVQQLPLDVQVVPAGVLRLVQLQAQNYAYIKP